VKWMRSACSRTNNGTNNGTVIVYWNYSSNWCLCIHFRAIKIPKQQSINSNFSWTRYDVYVIL
jgi:hypothetical protein